MNRQLLFAIAAGLIAATVFAVANTGPMVARMALFFITPLPIFLAGLSAGWATAAFAGLIGAFAISLVSTPLTGAAFALTQAVPPALLCYFALLHRDLSHPADSETGNASKTAREWYPLGQIVLWAAAISIVLAVISLFMIAGSVAELETILRGFLNKFIDAQTTAKTTKALSEADREMITKVTLYLLPAITTATILMSLLFNLWLAGRIALASNQLARPWPMISAITYPAGTPIALAAAMIASWSLSEFAGLAASAAAGGLFFAYVLLGLAVIHHITLDQPWRPFALWALYTTLVILNSAFTVLIAIIGLAEPFSPLRRDFINHQNGPPADPG